MNIARPQPLPELISTRELAVQLGIPVSTLRFWRKRGEGPPGFKIGKRVVYRTADVARWLEEQRRTA
jgi:DNA-binding transcriptional MerR regulator